MGKLRNLLAVTNPISIAGMGALVIGVIPVTAGVLSLQGLK